MTEVLNADGTPHESDGRATIEGDDEDFWFGFEQEYFLWDPVQSRPPGFPANGFPRPQGPYYCSVGAANAYGRQCVDEHLDLCLNAGINVEGINAEVAAGQWEFQVFAKGAKQAGDETWIARYLAERNAEKHGWGINWHPKPLGDTDWNGSGMHANFSNGTMRETGDEGVFTKICEEFSKNIRRHIDVYGADNERRLTGRHETQSIDTFSYGLFDRGASIRIPVATVEAGWKGAFGRSVDLHPTLIRIRLHQQSLKLRKRLSRRLSYSLVPRTRTGRPSTRTDGPYASAADISWGINIPG